MDKKEFAALKEGDKVTVRQWDDMKKEYGADIWGFSIRTPTYSFISAMKDTCGKTYKIKNRASSDVVLLSVNGTYYFTAEMLESNKAKEEAPPVIVEHLIRGNKTIVKLSNGKVGVARCNPEDAFDVFEGLRQAAARAYGKTLPLTFAESMANFAKACKKAAKEAKKKMEAEAKAQKPVFVPHLKNIYGINSFGGVIGAETKYKDEVGRPLKIGDTVELYIGGDFYGEEAVVENLRNGEPIIFGISGTCDGKTGKIKDGWKIIKKRSFEEVKDGEIVGDCIKYIKTEAAENA